MAFTVPQFIEKEPKIVGPLTFKQFVFIAIAGGACFLLYFYIGKRNFFLFIITAVILMGGSLAFSFLKIKGYSLPIILKNFFVYTISPKIFIWRRKIVPSKIKKIEKFEKEIEEETALKIAKRSRLQELSTRVETGNK